MSAGERSIAGSSTEPLDRRYDLAMLDLDGVVYIGRDAVPGAPEHVAAARAAGMRVAFITNNASRPPDAVAEHLRELGRRGRPPTTWSPRPRPPPGCSPSGSARAPGWWCSAPTGWPRRVAEAGLVPVGVDDDAEAVVTGYGPDVRWRDDHAGRGADPRRAVVGRVQHRPDDPDGRSGSAPGHGVLVETLRRFTGVEPVVAGKPARPLLDETVRRCGGERPLMVGDRLDTDIEGAHAAGVDSLLVMTGVTGLAELVAAGPELRPTYLSADLGGLAQPHPAPELEDDACRLGRLDAPGSSDGALRGRRARGAATTGGGWWRWRPGDTSTRPGEPVATDGVSAAGVAFRA